MSDSVRNDPEPDVRRVLVTGATGFVGRHVLHTLYLRGYRPVCLVRSPERLVEAAGDVPRSRVDVVVGSLFNRVALRDAVQQADAVIHLVGIILEDRLRRQTFDRIHRRGTMAVVDAMTDAGVRRYIHMSALGARPDAVATYHKTKFQAEQYVRDSGLDWTVFQPSIIHGWDGEFMRLLKAFACGLIPPVMPYFGRGENRLQPVSVKDVAHCFVEALRRPQTVRATYPLGGPATYTWKELYAVCRRLMPGARRWKPMVSQPLPVAKLLALTVMKTPLVPRRFKFNVDQVRMSQEDSVCPTEPAESAFEFKYRAFEAELARYAERIG